VDTLSYCSTDIIVALGTSGSNIDTINLYKNNITMGTNWYDTPNANHIDGIHLWTSGYGLITNLKIYQNFVSGDPSTHSTSHIFLEGSSAVQSIIQPLIYNNIIIGNNNHPTGGYIGVGAVNHPKIYNNTIFGLGSSSSGGVGILSDVKDTIEIANNIIDSCFMGIYNDAQNSQKYISDYNSFYNVGYIGGSSSFYTTLSTWTAYASADTHSIVSNPNLKSNYMENLSSPTIDAGKSLASYFTTDYSGATRTGAWDIGAYEFYVGSAKAKDFFFFFQKAFSSFFRR
jgi:hypothetical protein